MGRIQVAGKVLNIGSAVRGAADVRTPPPPLYLRAKYCQKCLKKGAKSYCHIKGANLTVLAFAIRCG